MDRSKDQELHLRDCGKINDVEMANNAMRQAGGVGVKSISSGSESISFSDVVSPKDLNNEIYAIGKEYLTSTGLLYAGW